MQKHYDQIANMNLGTIRYSIGSSACAFFLGLFYYVSRLGLHDKHLSHIIAFIGVSLFLLNVPTSIRRNSRVEHLPWFNELLLTVYLLIALIAISYTGIPYLIFLIGFTGAWCLGQNVVLLLKSKPGRPDWSLIAVAILLPVWIAAVCWRGDFLSPLFLEGLELTEENGSSLDPLFHMAIAQMLKHYSEISNGLHGLEYVKYHFLSHFIMSRLSVLADSHMIYTYNVGHVLIFPPLLLKVFLTLVNTGKALYPAARNYSKLSWVILAAGLTSIMPAYLFNNLSVRAAIGHNSLFMSESYLLSILLALVVVYTLMQKKVWEKPFNYGLFIFLPVAVILITLAKVSTGYLLVGALGYLFIRLGLYRKWVAILLMLIIVVSACAIAFMITDRGAVGSGVQWMSFFTIEVQTRFRYFLILFYFWLGSAGVMFAIIYFMRRRTTVSIDLKKTQLALEVIIIVAILGFLPPATMRILGASGIYFLEPQRWLAVLLCIVLLPTFVDVFKISNRLLNVLMIIIIGILSFNTLVQLSKSVKHNLLCRTYYVRPALAQTFGNIDSRNLPNIKEVAQGILKAPLVDSFDYKLKQSDVFTSLQNLTKMDELQHKGKLIYIKDYTLLHERILCYHYFYMIPAFTGFAVYQGLDYWCVGEGYFLDQGDVTRTAYDRTKFCQEISDWGFGGFYSYDLRSGNYEMVGCE